MRLYKMELYKLCCRKIFIMGAILVIGIVLVVFHTHAAAEEASVDGTCYTGYRAVQVNRQITEEFRGVLTDEKVDQIEEKYSGDTNFLSRFVMSYLSYGGSIADSDLGAVKEMTGQEIMLEYYQGWNTFLEVMLTGMIVGSILILFSISVIFANEGQTKMLQIIFTTKEGREKEVYAKIAAAMTVAVSVWAVIFFLDLLLCGIVYGLDGLDCYNGMVLSYLFPWPEKMIPMRSYIMTAAVLSLFGVVSLCASTICVSANNKNNLHALSAAAICYVAPVVIAMLTDELNGAARILCAAPVFMVIHIVIEDIYNIRAMPLIIAVLISIVCTVIARRKYSRQQVV